MKALPYLTIISVSTLLVCSCGLLGKSTSSTTTEQTVINTATTDGQAAGAALKSLYTQYKSAGKLELTNMNNILSLTTLVQNVKGLKGQSEKSTFYKDFASGLILGSSNLVTEATSSTVMSGLGSLAENVDASSILNSLSNSLSSETTSNVSTAVSDASNIADSVTSILKLFK